ncbi:MAG: cupin domain-containing protein [Nitrospinae bacterium]|nr:cupin domain-containing protein [Nitrospinota bacterium]MYA95916.1 cupin domain-containing protein [Nitrospinota bacterium]
MKKPAYRLEDVAIAYQCEPEQEEIISALAERDYRVFEVEQPAGAFVPYHTHDEEEAVIVIEGQMQFNVEEELVLVQQGEVITIREEAIHSAAQIGEEKAKLLLAFPNDGSDPPVIDLDWEGDEEDDNLGYA